MRTPTRASIATRPGSSGSTSRPWENADVRFNHEPKRSRKLLLHREEIDELLGKTKAKGLTLVPLRLYINDQGKAKVLLGLAQGQADLGPPPGDRRARRQARDRARRGRRPATVGRCGSRG